MTRERMVPARAQGLAGLAELREVLAARRREEAQRRAREHAQRLAEDAAAQLFRTAVGKVTPLRASRRAELPRPRPEPWPHQREADERAALLQTWSDEVDVESLLLTDDGLSFRRPGIGADVVARLRRGQWTIQAEIDLHGLRRDEARQALRDFLDLATRRAQRCVRIVHGKGHGSPGRRPVLKARVQRWLAQSAAVLAFAQASGPQGGAGALIALLDRGARRGRSA
ncbi:MAG: Smr/MutS family protein [Burkholderiales bacterium]|nr:Smr/MutS family protein [Burkholderiales bacterium]